MNAFAEVEIAKLDEHQLAEIAHQDETIHKIGDLLRIGSEGNTDFVSVKLKSAQFDQLMDTGELGMIRRGLLDFHKDKIADIKFEFRQNGSPDIGTVRISVTSNPAIIGGRLAGPDALYAAAHSISSRFKR